MKSIAQRWFGQVISGLPLRVTGAFDPYPVVIAHVGSVVNGFHFPSVDRAGDALAFGAVFRTWVERHPSSAVALASLGSFCRETGEGERAVALFREAIAAVRTGD